MIKEILKKLDFSEKEIEIYLAILKSGKITPADLAKITGINRSTVYVISSELGEKGVISHDLSGPIKYLVAVPPEELENIIKKEEKRIESRKVLVSRAIEELKSFSGDVRYSLPKIRFIAEEELENFLYKQADRWDESLLKTEPCWYGFQDHTYAEFYSSNIDWYWSRADKNIQLKLITNESNIEKVIQKRDYEKRQMKFLKKKVPFTATTWVIGDYIVMVFTNQRPHYAIEIKNTEFARNQRELFKFLWELV
jgi:sugar-specific transcriptional regulator TrmB